MKSSALASRIQAGDQTAWPELYRLNKGLVAMLVGRHENASRYESRADICGDVWVSVCKALVRGLYKPDRQKFGVWLWTVTRNHMYQRKLYRHELDLAPIEAGLQANGAPGADLLLDIKRIVTADEDAARKAAA